MTPYDRAIDWLSGFVVVGRIEIVAVGVLGVLAGVLIGAVVGRQMLKRRLHRDTLELASAQASEYDESVRGGALAARVGQKGVLAKATPPNEARSAPPDLFSPRSMDA
jgi:hypothetical protein